MIALVPMRNVVLFPHVLMPISVGRPRSIAAVQHAVGSAVSLGIVMQRDALGVVGTLARVVQRCVQPWAMSDRARGQGFGQA